MKRRISRTRSWRSRHTFLPAAFIAAVVLQISWVPPTEPDRVPATAALPAHPLPKLSIGVPKTEAQLPGAEKTGLPRRLKIPAIGVDATIQRVELTKTKQLDVPSDPAVVGWYGLGPRPGDEGTAILDGHLDIGKTKGVFWNLRHLRVGQTLTVTDAEGKERTFRVNRRKIYDVVGAPLEEVYGFRPGKNLRIITCAGVWRKSMNHYDKRLVIFAEEVPAS